MALDDWFNWPWNIDGNMNELHFLRPHFLYLFVPFAVLYWICIKKVYRSNIWDKITSADLKPHVLKKPNNRNYLRNILMKGTKYYSMHSIYFIEILI